MKYIKLPDIDKDCYYEWINKNQKPDNKRSKIEYLASLGDEQAKHILETKEIDIEKQVSDLNDSGFDSEKMVNKSKGVMLIQWGIKLLTGDDFNPDEQCDIPVYGAIADVLLANCLDEINQINSTIDEFAELGKKVLDLIHSFKNNVEEEKKEDVRSDC